MIHPAGIQHQSYNDGSDGPPAERAGLTELLSVLKRRKLTFATIFISLSAIVALAALLQPTTYAGTSVVKVSGGSEQEQPALLAARMTSEDELKIATIIEEMRSRRVAGGLAQMIIDEPTLPMPEDENVFSNLRKLVARGDDGPPERPDPEDTAARERLINLIMARTDVRRLSNSRLIEITAVESTPERAASIANALVEVYLESERVNRRRYKERKVQRLTEQVNKAQVELYNTDLAIAKYMRENNLLTQKSGGAIEAQTANLERALANAQIESASRGLNDLLEEEERLADRLVELSVIYGPGYPEVVDVKAQLEALRTKIDTERTQVNDQLRSRRAEIDASAAALSRELSAVRSRHFDALEANAGLRELERKAEARLSIFTGMMVQLQKAEIDLGENEDQIAYISTALAANSVIGSGPAKIMAVGALGAWALAFLGALAAEGLDRNIRSADQVRSFLGAPTLAMLPLVRFKKIGPGTIGQFLEEHPEAPYSEGLRNLFLELISRETVREPRVVVVTSVLEGGGKTTVASGVAAMAARFDYRAVVVTLDRKNMLKPATATSFNPEQEPQSEAPVSGEGQLVDTGDASPVIVEHEDHVSLGALSRDFMRLANDWDLVIVDAPPILKSRDAKALAAHASDIVVVMEWGKTGPRAMRAVKDVLGSAEFSVVINRVNLKAHARRGYGDAIEFSS